MGLAGLFGRPAPSGSITAREQQVLKTNEGVLAGTRAKAIMLLFSVGGICAVALMLVRLAVTGTFEILVDGSLIWLAISLVVAGVLTNWGAD